MLLQSQGFQQASPNPRAMSENNYCIFQNLISLCCMTVTFSDLIAT